MKIFVGNIPYQANDALLGDWFEKNGFPINSVDLAIDRLSGQPRGFGYVEMSDKAAAECILACNGMDFLGRTLIVNDASTLGTRRPLTHSKRA